METTVDKINHKRGKRMRGRGPDKLFKMEIKKYLKKKEEENKDVFNIDNVEWKGLYKDKDE